MTSADFKLTLQEVQHTDGSLVTMIAMRGWLDAQSENTLFAAAQEAHTQGAKRLILNMADLELTTSAGIRSLQKIYRLFTTSNPDTKKTGLRLCSAPPQVYHALAVTGFLQTVPMYENLQAAMTSYE